MIKLVRFFFFCAAFLLNGNFSDEMRAQIDAAHTIETKQTPPPTKILKAVKKTSSIQSVLQFARNTEEWLMEEEEEKKTLQLSNSSPFVEPKVSYATKTPEYFCNYIKKRLSFHLLRSGSNEQQSLYLFLQVIRI